MTRRRPMRYRTSFLDRARRSRSSSGRPHIRDIFPRTYFPCTYVYIYISHVEIGHPPADGLSFRWKASSRNPPPPPSRPGLFPRPGYPPARDFRLALLMLDNADLAIISGELEKNPGEKSLIPCVRWVFLVSEKWQVPGGDVKCFSGRARR